jgi:hypothetical protein
MTICGTKAATHYVIHMRRVMNTYIVAAFGHPRRSVLLAAPFSPAAALQPQGRPADPPVVSGNLGIPAADFTPPVMGFVHSSRET